MKKYILFLTLFLTVAIGTPLFTSQNVNAEAYVEYRRVITQTTPFFSDSSGTNLLFNLPYTYYVKVLEEGAVLTHVECYGTGGTIALDGYVPTEQLFNDGLAVHNPYLEQKISTVSTAVLYSDKGLTNPLQYIFTSRELSFYGQITGVDGSVLFYVGYNDRLGYVKESQILPFETNLHPNELTFLAPEPEEPDIPPQAENSENLLTVRIIIITCLVLAGVIALFVALKGKGNKRASTSYYDENEYE